MYSSLIFLTVIFTVTTSFEPSGYSTSACPVVIPGVFTTGGVFHDILVPSGNPVLFILLSTFGTCPLFTTCGICFGLNQPFIEYIVIFIVLDVGFPALSITFTVTPYCIFSLSFGALSTSFTPCLNTIVLEVLSYTRNDGKLLIVIVPIPLPPTLSSAITFINGIVLSRAVIFQFSLSTGVWITGGVTSLIVNGI